MHMPAGVVHGSARRCDAGGAQPSASSSGSCRFSHVICVLLSIRVPQAHQAQQAGADAAHYLAIHLRGRGWQRTAALAAAAGGGKGCSKCEGAWA